MSGHVPPTDLPHPPVPLFVFGVARSGTSYMHRLLNAHPRMRISYEGRTVREGGYLYGRCRNLRDRAQFDKLLDKLCQCEEEESLNHWMIEVMRQHGDELFRLHTREPSFPKLIENIYMRPEPVACWGNKVLRIEACPDLLRLWPAAKVIILIRDPRAVYSSMFKFRRTRIKYATVYWNLHARWTRLHATDPRRFLVVRYEELVENAPAQLKRILQHVDLWDPEIAKQMLAAHPTRPASLTKWRDALTPGEVRTVESYCFEEMKRWQYTPELAHRQKRMGVFTRGLETILEYARVLPRDPNWWMRKQIVRRFFRTLRG